MYDDMNWWKNVSMSDFTRQFKSSLEANAVLSLKEKELYKETNKTTLSELTNSADVSIGAQLSLSDYTAGVDIIKASLGGELGISMKLSSKGKWVEFLQSEIKNNTSNAEKIKNIYPQFKGNSLVASPMDHYRAYENFWENISSITVPSSGNYPLKESVKMELQNKTKINAEIEIPLFTWGVFDFNLEAGLELEAEDYPSESYYGVKDQYFYPITKQPHTDIGSALKSVSNKIKNRVSSLFESFKDEIYDKAKEFVGDLTEEVKDWVEKVFSTSSSHHGNRVWAKRRQKALANASQNDVCTLSFTIPGNSKCFNTGTELDFNHFYPGGFLIAVTDQNDSLFVVSEIANLTAKTGNTQLKKAPNGKFKLETTVGADDLTPFGFAADQPLDVYHSEIGADKWHYVGPAGSILEVDSLGSYILATSIKNDKQAPELTAFLDRSTGIIRVAVSDNIGIESNSLRIYVNGIPKTISRINESYFAVRLTANDLQSLITVYATCNDLVGNCGHVFQLYEYNNDINISIPTTIDKTKKDKDDLHIKIHNKKLTIEGTEIDANSIITIFNLGGGIICHSTTDDTGKAQIDLSSNPAGVYVITISSGKSRKIIIK